MGIFKNNKKETVIEERYANVASITDIINGGNFVTVNEKNVMKVPSVKKAVESISNTVATLPIYLYQEVNGKVQRVDEDVREALLNGQCNGFMTGDALKNNITKELLLHGKSYSLLDKKGLEVKGIHYLENRNVSVDEIINNRGFLVDREYHYVLNTKSNKTNSFNVLEINYGRGVLTDAEQILETQLKLYDYEKYIFENAMFPLGILETDGRLTKETATSLKAQLERLYGGVRNFFRPMVLEQGLKWKQISQRPSDLMMDKFKESQIEDVERVFNLPTGYLKRSSTGINVAEENAQYLRAITPILVSIESGLNRCLLLEDEKKNGYFFRFDTSELMKTTFKELVEIGVTAINGGMMTVNESRYLIDLPPIPDGDTINLNLGGQGKELTGEEAKENENVETPVEEDIEGTE